MKKLLNSVNMKLISSSLSLTLVFILALVTTTTVCAAISGSSATELDRIIAIVEDDVITNIELRNEITKVRTQMRQQNIPIPAYSELEKQVLERMVLKRLQMQLAENSGIQVDEDTLNRTLSNIAAQNNLSLNEFRKRLESDGINFVEFRNNLRDEIIIRRLRQRHVDSRVTITDQEIDSYIDTQRRQGNTLDEYNVSHILVAIPESASADAVEKYRVKAQQIHTELVQGADFNQTAINESDAPDAENGGNMGWRKLDELPELFQDKILQLGKNQVSRPIKSSSGFHIIKLSGHRRGESHFVTKTRVRHILIKTNELISDQDARQRIIELADQVASGEDFAQLAKKYSDDPATANDGGNLGWISPGALVQNFEEAMNRLQPGELSKPTKTGYGWHLIQVLDRQEFDDTEEFYRQKIREELYSRKTEEEYINWLRQLREEAYVEVR